MSVFILIHGFSSSCTWFHYKDIQKDYLEKLDFVDNLKKIGKVYKHNMNFFNLNYFYQIENDEKEKEGMRIIVFFYILYMIKIFFQIIVNLKSFVKKI